MIKVDVIRITRTSFRMRAQGMIGWVDMRWNSTLDPMHPEQSASGIYIVGGETFEDAVKAGGRALRQHIMAHA